MKKYLIIPAIFLTACQASNHDGKYFNHSQNEYSITDDTLEVRGSIIIEHTGFQRIRNGVTQPKEFKTKPLFELHPQFNGNQLILNQTTYEKL
jgi:hypothetical protein